MWGMLYKILLSLILLINSYNKYSWYSAIFIRMTMSSLLAIWHNNSALPVFTLGSCSFRSWPSTFINVFFSVNVPTMTKNKNSQMFHFMITQQQVQYVRWFPFLEFSGRGLKHLYIGFKNKAIFCIIILHYQILFYII